MISFNAFITKYLGKKIDFDNAYAGQCVDLFRQYVQEVLGYPQPKGVSGAKDFWTNYETDPNLKNYYQKIENTPTGVPKIGDVMIWDKDAGGGFGHISVFIEGDVNGFTSFDQNWPTLSVCTKTKHNYDNVYGWLRPTKEAAVSDMYTMKSGNKVDLSNKDSNIVLADKFDEVVYQGVYVKKADADKDAENRLTLQREQLQKEKDEAVKQAFKDGQASVPTTPTPQPGFDPNPDPTKYEFNGFTITVENGVQAISYNYKLK